MIRVRIRDNAGADREIETFQPMASVGRAPDSGVRVMAPGVEWRHGQVLHRDGRVFYRDLQSRSGSRIRSSVRGEQVLEHTFHEVELFPGDEVVIGEGAFSITSVESEPYAVAPAETMPVVESRTTQDLEDLVRRLEKDHQILEQIYRFEKQLSDVFDLNRLFGAVSDAIFEVFEKATHLFIALVDGEEIELVLAGRRPGLEGLHGPASLSRFLVDQVMQKGEAFMFHLTRTGSLHLQQKDAREIDPTQSVRLNRIQSGICVPLWSGSSIIGVLEVDNRVEATIFSVEERDLLVLFANRAAMAIEKHRRYSRDLQAARDATIGQVVSKVVHDLTNHFGILRPLGDLTDRDLKALAVQMERADFDRTKVNETLALLQDNWDRVKVHHELMWDLLDDLRHYARGRKPEYEKIPLRKFVDICVEAAGFRAADRDRKVTFSISDSLERISFLADAVGVRRVVQNLLNNAVDAIPKGAAGRIEVDAKISRVDGLRYLKLSIRDNGIGIPEDILERIFEYGFSTKTGVSGSGFGLAVIRKVVSEHRGFIRLSSKKNEGTHVELYFPAIRKPDHLKRYPTPAEDIVTVEPWADSVICAARD